MFRRWIVFWIGRFDKCGNLFGMQLKVMGYGKTVFEDLGWHLRLFPIILPGGFIITFIRGTG